MSTLAICAPSLGVGHAKPRITQLHTNFWSFRTPGKRRYSVDLGLNIHLPANETNGSQVVSSLDVFVPAEVLQAEDVTGKLRDVPTAELIFNETCSVVNHGDLAQLKAGPKEYWLGEANPSVHEHQPTWSQIRVMLAPALRPGQSRYVRFRIEFRKPRQVVWAQGGGLSTALATYDLRLYEKRQWAMSDRLKTLIQQGTPLDVDTWQCFLIAPAASVLVEHNPPMKYMRLLEGDEWENYLGRKIERSSVYYWKAAPENGSFGPSRPHRVYAKFRIVHLGVIRITTWLPIALIFVGGLAVFESRTGFLRLVANQTRMLWGAAARNPEILLLLAVVGILAGFAPYLIGRWRRGRK